MGEEERIVRTYFLSIRGTIKKKVVGNTETYESASRHLLVLIIWGEGAHEVCVSVSSQGVLEQLGEGTVSVRDEPVLDGRRGKKGDVRNEERQEGGGTE